MVARRELGVELRELRNRVQVTAERAAEELDCSVSKISRIENGLVAPRLLEVKVLLTLYGVNSESERARLLALGGTGRAGAWYDEYQDLLGPGSVLHRFIGLESAAAAITSFSYGNIPGLLQTEEYARALYRELQSDRSDDEINRLIDLRLGRKKLLDRGVRYSVMIDESALLRPVGGVAVMNDQLDALRAAVERGACDLSVFPLRAGFHSILDGPFTLLAFDGKHSDLVFIEGPAGASFYEKPDVVKRFADLFESASKLALHGAELADRLKRAHMDLSADSNEVSPGVSR
jgi:transcriptional regulator with XRE-family HTH domain